MKIQIDSDEYVALETELSNQRERIRHLLEVLRTYRKILDALKREFPVEEIEKTADYIRGFPLSKF